MDYIEKTLDSEEIFKGKVFNVYKDTVFVEGKNTNSVREIIEHPGGSVIFAIDEDEKILFVKQYRYALKQHLIELPAGKLEKNEHPLDCAKRELVEECGFVAQNWQSLGFIFTSGGILNEKLYLFKATNLKFVGSKPDDGEVLTNLKLKKHEILEMIKNNQINDAKTICSVARAILL